METIYIILYISLGVNIAILIDHLEELYNEPPFFYMLMILFFPLFFVGITIKWLAGGYK
jgi:hypothetical protein